MVAIALLDYVTCFENLFFLVTSSLKVNTNLPLRLDTRDIPVGGHLILKHYFLYPKVDEAL